MTVEGGMVNHLGYLSAHGCGRGRRGREYGHYLHGRGCGREVR